MVEISTHQTQLGSKIFESITYNKSEVDDVVKVKVKVNKGKKRPTYGITLMNVNGMDINQISKRGMVIKIKIEL